MAAPKSFFLTPEVHEYVVAHGTPPDAVQQALIDETAQLPMAMMQISPEQGAFMTLFTRQRTRSCCREKPLRCRVRSRRSCTSIGGA